MKNTKKIKQQIKDEVYNFNHIGSWFFDEHLLGVEENANFLLENLPEANKEIVVLGVWLHDLQRIRGIKGDHQKVGAQEAEKVLNEYGYKQDVIEKVKKMILCHSCEGVMPKTLEEKILASADAMSHYYNDFYIRIATLGQRNLEEFREWAMEKLERDYNKKIAFAFAKEKIKSNHDILVNLFNMK
ncbi:MAG: HD domain-containing protein [Candidatus Pacebacteria bacterium]|nr:HD domain-containing protein [Candidatus Paceibacterota bacterium]